MRRFSVICGIVALLAGNAGCQTSGKTGALAWMQGLGSAGGRKSAERDNPFKDTSAETGKTAGDDATSPPGRFGSGTVAHDAKTLQFIRDEMKRSDASPEEKDAMLASLKLLDSTSAREILRSWKLGLQVHRSSQNLHLASRNEPADDNAARPSSMFGRPPQTSDVAGGGYSDGPGRVPAKSYSGLGVAPWNTHDTGFGSSPPSALRDDRYGERGRSSPIRQVSGQDRDDWQKREFYRTDDRGDGFPGTRLGGTAGSSSSVSSRPWDNPALLGKPAVAPGGDGFPGTRRAGSVSDRSDDPAGYDLRRDHRTDGNGFRGSVRPSGYFAGNESSTASRSSIFRDRGSDARFADSRGASSSSVRTEIAHSGPQVPISGDGSPANSLYGARGRSARVAPMSREWEQALQRLIAITDSEAAQSGPGRTPEDEYAYTLKHVNLRTLYLMAGKPQQAMEAIPGIDTADQEFWQQLFWARANYFEPDYIGDSRKRATQTVAQIRAAAQKLQQKANLEIHNLAFCREIVNFGNYKTFETSEFRGGDRVLIYAEVANFKSVQIESGMFQTVLKSRIELYKVGADGNGLVKDYEFRQTQDLCRNPRNDYFHSYEIVIPGTALLGNYVLKLIIDDRQGRQIASDTINFTVK